MKLVFKDRALLVTAALLLSSASLRLGLMAVPAMAKSADEAATTALSETVQAPSEPVGETASAAPHTPTPDGLQLVLERLRKKERDLNARERVVVERERAIEKANRELTAKLAELKQAENALRATLAEAEGATDKDIGRLVSVYEKMPPKDSAQLFEQMEPFFAAGFLSRMRPETAAGILAGMNPKSAYAISAVMAGRNAKVPKR
jgi:flagellar motility protein MotE (MotC chaperone)